MKLKYAQIEGFVKKPSPDMRVILVYGPDDGLMRERSKTMGRSVVADLNDPFNVSILQAGDIVSDAGRLFDEAAQISMMGGKRLVRIEDARDALAPAVKDYLKSPSDNALVIIEGGDLPGKSTLRALIDRATNAASVPCYVEDERGVATLIRTLLRDGGYNIESDALTWLASAVQGDRARIRGEVDKLTLYMGARKGITVADAQAACGDAGEQGMDDLIHAAAAGRPDAAMRAFAALTAEGTQAIPLLRALQLHFRKLHLTRARMDAGASVEEAMKQLSPPVFFKQEETFRAQLRRWSVPALGRVLDRLTSLEAECKRTGAPAELLCGQALLSISSR